ncbi:LysR family transcriptional regulator [Motiliproteus coralliicola]|uniref:LysR family transcriptional regulator n=1 Tax=Motiliproteus coralliicola TaxID=2283196 RepID=A0A369WCP5_9GAMM|nr:LysR substrate-binding domain-containing protein [Motiliproteus coralliicola]RDE18949.1 LysR family transcriptional regulator [Motiliproteus coralliicola]
MNAKQLNAFRAVMLSGSMVGAAKMLFVSQPAITRLIKDLEDSCGFELFERRNGRLFATPEGHALYQEVKRHFLGLDNLAQMAAQIRMNKTGRLRVASMPALAHSILPSTLSRFLRDRPDVSMTLTPGSTLEVAKLVAAQQFDLGVVMLPIDSSDVRFGPCFRVDCRVVMPNDHPLTALDQIEPIHLDDQPFVAIGHENTLTRYRIDATFAAAGIRPRADLETPLYITAQALVREGQGVSIIDPYTANLFEQQGGSSRPFNPAIPFYFGFIFPLHRQPSTLAEQFIEVFIEQSKSLFPLHPADPDHIDLR